MTSSRPHHANALRFLAWRARRRAEGMARVDEVMAVTPSERPDIRAEWVREKRREVAIKNSLTVYEKGCKLT